MKILLKTACGCSRESVIPDKYHSRYIEVPIYKRMAMPWDEVRSMEEVCQQDIHKRIFEFEGMQDDEGRYIYSEMFKP